MYIIIWKFKIKADIADLFLNFEIWLERSIIMTEHEIRLSHNVDLLYYGYDMQVDFYSVKGSH